MRCIWAFLFVLMSPNIYSETIVLCSSDRFGVAQADGSGYYWDLLRVVYEAEGVILKHLSAPFQRCLDLVESKEVDGAVAVFETPERRKKFTYPKSRLSFSSYGLIHLRQTPFDKLENVRGDVGVIRGYDFSAWLPSSLSIVPLDNNIQAIKMLNMRRLEYHADDINDVLLTLKKIGERSDNFSFKELHVRSLFNAMTKDVRGQTLADKFDSGLRKAFKSGGLERLLKKYEVKNSILGDFD